MNPAEKRIFDIIKADVCGECEAHGITTSCHFHRTRCYAGYERQAR